MIAAIFLAVIVLLAVTLPDKRLPKNAMPAFNLKKFLTSFWISPAKHPDFGWAWITRFCIIIPSAAVTVFLVDYFQSALGDSHAAAETHYTTFSTIYGIILIACALLSGFISDRIQRRKLFVMAAGFVVGISMFILAFFHTWGAATVAAALFGLGFGIYLAVDYALLTEVLPSQSDRGKDMGVFNIANSSAPGHCPHHCCRDGGRVTGLYRPLCHRRYRGCPQRSVYPAYQRGTLSRFQTIPA